MAADCGTSSPSAATWSGRSRQAVRDLRRRRGGGPGDAASTGKTFAATQSHWFRLADGKIIEHWANRDDLAMAQQLGWIPRQPPLPGPLWPLSPKHRARTAAR